MHYSHTEKRTIRQGIVQVRHTKIQLGYTPLQFIYRKIQTVLL